MTKAILVLGATGKQGGGVLRALLCHPAFDVEKYTIYAATRDPTSASARKLTDLSPSIRLVMGDLNKPADIFANLPASLRLWAVFAVTLTGKTETADGIGIIDEAIRAGASHITYSSVDRGVGNPASVVPHFKTKHLIEAHLKEAAQAKEGALSYTIIRPPYFLDNIDPKTGFQGRLFATLWRNRVHHTMTVVDTADIGSFGAAAILESDSEVYRNAEINIAGDKLTFEEANRIYKQKFGHDIPTTYDFLVSILLFMVHDIKKMVEFFNEPGFGGSTAESNTLHHMANFAEWADRVKGRSQ